MEHLFIMLSDNSHELWPTVSAKPLPNIPLYLFKVFN